VDGIRHVVLSFYTPEEITIAKKLLVREFFVQIKNTSFTTERRSSAVRPAHDAEIDDIIGILDDLDAQQALDTYLFVSSDITRIPKYGPEELNIGAVVERQLRVETVVDNLAAPVEQLSSRFGTGESVQPTSTESVDKFAGLLDNRISSLSAMLDAQVTEIKKTCSQTLKTSVTPVQQQPVIDRSCNIVLFGVDDCNGNDSTMRSKVDDILLCVNGQPVVVRDMFRLGRYQAGKNRPILVKLQSAWDRRIILSKRSTLHNSVYNNVYIV